MGSNTGAGSEANHHSTFIYKLNEVAPAETSIVAFKVHVDLRAYVKNPAVAINISEVGVGLSGDWKNFGDPDGGEVWIDAKESDGFSLSLTDYDMFVYHFGIK